LTLIYAYDNILIVPILYMKGGLTELLGAIVVFQTQPKQENFLQMTSCRKIVIKYRDRNGIVRTKSCGNAAAIRECKSWLLREGFEYLGQEDIRASRKPQKPVSRMPRVKT